MELITEEKDRYSSYIALCAQYNIEPDKSATIQCSTKIEVLEAIMKLM